MDARRRCVTILYNIYARNIDNTLGSVVYTIGRTCVITWKNIYIYIHFDLLKLLHLKSNSESWNEILCDLQLLTRWDKALSDLTFRIVSGVGHAHNRGSYYYCLALQMTPTIRNWSSTCLFSRRNDCSPIPHVGLFSGNDEGSEENQEVENHNAEIFDSHCLRNRLTHARRYCWSLGRSGFMFSRPVTSSSAMIPKLKTSVLGWSWPCKAYSGAT